MSVSDLSASAQNYLKTVWSLAEWSDEPVIPSLIASKIGLKLSTVSEAVRKLTDQGLLDHTPYGAVTLTEQGRAYALSMVRRHRLIETFLVQTLGYGWDQVHDEAETLEHAVSDFMIEQIDRVLGYPTRDPHGDPIPDACGALPFIDAAPLTQSDVGSTVIVERISDDDPELLQHFAAQGIVIGARLAVTKGAPFSDSVVATVEALGHPVTLGVAAMSALFVSQAPQAPQLPPAYGAYR